MKMKDEYSDKTLPWLWRRLVSMNDEVEHRLIEFVKSHGTYEPFPNNPKYGRIVYHLTDTEKKYDCCLGIDMDKFLEDKKTATNKKDVKCKDYEIQFEDFELSLDETCVFIKLNNSKSTQQVRPYTINVIYFLEKYEEMHEYDSMIAKCSKPIHFENKTIIITDPCYILSHINEKDYKKNGITNYLECTTFYGDWSCTTFNTDSGDVIGEFCADTGMVGVYDLDEVRCNNMFVDSWLEEHNWCATIIHNFTGDVLFDIKENKFMFNGEEQTEHSLTIKGFGNINFIGKQTGF